MEAIVTSNPRAGRVLRLEPNIAAGGDLPQTQVRRIVLRWCRRPIA